MSKTANYFPRDEKREQKLLEISRERREEAKEVIDKWNALREGKYADKVDQGLPGTSMEKLDRSLEKEKVALGEAIKNGDITPSDLAKISADKSRSYMGMPSVEGSLIRMCQMDRMATSMANSFEKLSGLEQPRNAMSSSGPSASLQHSVHPAMHPAQSQKSAGVSHH